MILNKDFKARVWPNSNDAEDAAAAELAQSLLKDLNARNDHAYDDEKEDVALWMAIAGVGFMRDIPSMDLGGKVNKDIKKGDVLSQSIIPFNVFPDEGPGKRLRDKRYVGIQSLKSKEWVKKNYPNFKDKGTTEDILGLNYQRVLMNLVAQVSSWKQTTADMYGAGMGTISDEDLVVFRELEFAPTAEYPKGRYACYCNGEILADEKRLPIPIEDGKWCYSLEDFHFNLVPGRFWSDASINDLISPQNTINKIDQALEMNRRGIGRPVVITPADMELRRLTKEDASFIALTYNPKKSGGMAPVISRGTPLPQQVLAERAIQQNTAQDAAGDPKGVLRGQAPTASASGYMVDVMRETAEQGHAPDIVRFYRSLQRSYRKRLVIAQELYTEKRLLKIKGSDGKYLVKSFKASDLRGNTDVRLELTSGLSTTNAGKTQTLINLVSAGLFNPQIMTEQDKLIILKMLGMSNFVNQHSPDARRAELEITQLINGSLELYVGAIPIENDVGEPLMERGPNGPQPVMMEPVQDPLFEFDDHGIHYESHRDFVVSSRFRDLTTETQNICLAHLKQHQLKLQQAAQQAHEQQFEDLATTEQIKAEAKKEKEAATEPVPTERPQVETMMGIR